MPMKNHHPNHTLSSAITSHSTPMTRVLHSGPPKLSTTPPTSPSCSAVLSFKTVCSPETPQTFNISSRLNSHHTKKAIFFGQPPSICLEMESLTSKCFLTSDPRNDLKKQLPRSVSSPRTYWTERNKYSRPNPLICYHGFWTPVIWMKNVSRIL